MSSRHDGVVERLGEPLRLSDTDLLDDVVTLGQRLGHRGANLSDDDVTT